MNEFLERALWIEFHVAAWFLLAVAICYAQRAREPRWLGGLAAAGLGMSFVIIAAGYLPIRSQREPAARSLGVATPIQEALPSIATHPRAEPAPETIAPSDFERGVSSNSPFHEALRTLTRLLTDRPQIREAPNWLRLTWQCVYLSSIVYGVMRLALGFMHRTRIVRRGVRVEDEVVTQIVARLQAAAAGGRTPRILESARVVSPATFGWTRPTILLPTSWRDWTVAELESVLAHEFAHIERGDYRFWLIGRIVVALHAYHPAAHWLAGQLHLQQEIAADRRAASRLGNRRGYLKALVNLALQQDEAVASRMLATAFLPSPSTLLRRIEMLRIMDDSSGSKRGWFGRVATLLTFLVAIALITALQATGQVHATPPAGAVTAPDEPGSSLRESEQPPNPQGSNTQTTRTEQIGFLALRPTKLRERLPQAVGEQLYATVDAELRAGLAGFVESDTEVTLDGVEEVIAPVHLGLHSLAVGVECVRLTAPLMDPDAVRRVIPEAVRQTRGDMTVYGLEKDSRLLVLLRGTQSEAWPDSVLDDLVPFVWTRDQQTFVMANRTDMAAAEANHWQSESARVADWSRVNRGVLSWAFEAPSDSFAKFVVPTEPITAAQKQALTDFVRCLGYVEMTEQLTIDATFCFRSEAAAANGDQQLQALIGLARLAGLARKDDAPEAPSDQVRLEQTLSQLQRQLLDGAVVETTGSEVHLRATAPMDLVVSCIAQGLTASATTHTARGASGRDVK